MAGIDQVETVFGAAGLQVVSLVVLAVEEVVRGDFFQVVEPLRQPLLDRQAERIEQVAPGKITVDDRVAVLLGNAALIQQLRRPILVLKADHHRFDAHQMPERRRQVAQGVGFIDVGEGFAHVAVPAVQGAKGQGYQRIVLCFAHAPQSSG
ncbi:hypothetical protein D3C80_1491380 [compost metagenome]